MRHLWNRARLVIWALATLAASPVWADEPVVQAVLFYSPTCPHCHKVIVEDLPPLFEKYGAQLQIVGVNVAEQDGRALYQAAVERFGIPDDQRGVPMLVVGDTVLIGSASIPERLPALIEDHLAHGGVGWPDIPGLAEALAMVQPTPDDTASETPAAAATATAEMLPSATSQLGAAPIGTAPTPVPTATMPTPAPVQTEPAPGLLLPAQAPAGVRERWARDPVGNTAAIGVLIGMVAATGQALMRLWRSGCRLARSRWGAAIPLLSLLGLGVAGYLSYVEITQTTAVCGPVGDCNAVQQSEYARLFGVAPIGVLGLAGYLAILLAWLAGQFTAGRAARLARYAVFAMALLGTLFSIYLTFLEPFVIGATCAWCLTSAVVITLTLLFAL